MNILFPLIGEFSHRGRHLIWVLSIFQFIQRRHVRIYTLDFMCVCAVLYFFGLIKEGARFEKDICMPFLKIVH